MSDKLLMSLADTEPNLSFQMRARQAGDDKVKVSLSLTPDGYLLVQYSNEDPRKSNSWKDTHWGVLDRAPMPRGRHFLYDENGIKFKFEKTIFQQVSIVDDHYHVDIYNTNEKINKHIVKYLALPEIEIHSKQDSEPNERIVYIRSSYTHTQWLGAIKKVKPASRTPLNILSQLRRYIGAKSPE